MTINDVAKNIEDVDLSNMILKETPFFKKVDDEKLKDAVEKAFEGYSFDGKENIRFVKESFNKWDYVAKIASFSAPEIRIYLNSGIGLTTEVVGA